MKKAMNDFREWLSDNLRYFILGFAIIIILVLLWLGFHFLTTIINSTQDKEQHVSSEQVDDPDQDGENLDDPNKDNEEENNGNQDDLNQDDLNQEEDTSNPGGELEKGQYSDVNVLIFDYYKALSERDVDSLKGILDSLSSEDEQAILNSDYIESYSNVEVYTKQGLTEGSYVVFVCYGHKYKGYDTILPGMSYLYVETAEDGSLYVLSEITDEQMEHITAVLNAEDTQQLISETQNAYDEALQGDAQLKAYLSKLGVI